MKKYNVTIMMNGESEYEHDIVTANSAEEAADIVREYLITTDGSYTAEDFEDENREMIVTERE